MIWQIHESTIDGANTLFLARAHVPTATNKNDREDQDVLGLVNGVRDVRFWSFLRLCYV